MRDKNGRFVRGEPNPIGRKKDTNKAKKQICVRLTEAAYRRIMDAARANNSTVGAEARRVLESSEGIRNV